ncbi:MAG: glycosyltransferase family 9 protein, partial [Chitinivibrionales bacterium]|nr:glycosyltransferase family 9 protein [Chitinivibrionales bacterium]
MNILIIRFSSMGDVILASAVFSFLQKRDAHVSIWLCTDPQYTGLFQDDHRLAGVLPIARNNEASLNEGELKGVVFDRIVDLQNNRRSRRLIGLLDPKIPVCKFDKKHLKRILLLAFRLNTFSSDDHVVVRYCRAAAGGDPGDQIPTPRILIHDDSNTTGPVSSILSGSTRPALALAPFAAWKNKEWPQDYYCMVGKYFAAHGFRVLIFGGRNDAAGAQSLARSIGESATALAGGLSLYECASVLKRCALSLGNDTGLLPLARAGGIKTGG